MCRPSKGVLNQLAPPPPPRKRKKNEECHCRHSQKSRRVAASARRSNIWKHTVIETSMSWWWCHEKYLFFVPFQFIPFFPWCETSHPNCSSPGTISSAIQIVYTSISASYTHNTSCSCTNSKRHSSRCNLVCRACQSRYFNHPSRQPSATIAIYSRTIQIIPNAPMSTPHNHHSGSTRTCNCIQQTNLSIASNKQTTRSNEADVSTCIEPTVHPTNNKNRTCHSSSKKESNLAFMQQIIPPLCSLTTSIQK